MTGNSIEYFYDKEYKGSVTETVTIKKSSIKFH